MVGFIIAALLYTIARHTRKQYQNRLLDIARDIDSISAKQLQDMQQLPEDR